MMRGVIFDLDGTLVDSLDDIAAALNAALFEMRAAPVRREQVRAWVGDGIHVLCQRACPSAEPQRLEALVRSAREHYLAGCLDATAPYPNILKMLSLMKSANVPMGVLTNKPDALARQILVGLDLVRFFTEITGAEGAVPRKPEPSAALSMASLLHRAPRDVLLVGDSQVDILTARNAGMTAVAVCWGFRDRRELIDCGPDHLVADPLEIVPLALAGA